jgi:hypothetical protein
MSDARYIPMPGSTPEERLQRMYAEMAKLLPAPPEGKTFAVSCDFCNLRLWIEAPADADIAHLAQLAMTGWARLESGDDACPGCQ